MNLHENTDQFKEAIRVASDHFDIREEFIEKDYWVTFILKKLSESEFRDQVVFKGGTSLSKVYNLIDRFSEDVDLAIIKSPDQTDTNIRNLIRKVEKHITKGFTEVYVNGLTSKRTKFNYCNNI
ncbi:MAG: nucleotidyl transferase AbiEii/AbiGii toxin family protein [Bacteroidales bacterium]|nr:nucleotidyl transferase AbiEii/AbiGii toxin family protein [Bacteroidales bacterium]